MVGVTISSSRSRGGGGEGAVATATRAATLSHAGLVHVGLSSLGRMCVTLHIAFLVHVAVLVRVRHVLEAVLFLCRVPV